MRLRAFALALVLTFVSALAVSAQTGGTIIEQHSAPAKTTVAWTSVTAGNTAATVTVTNLAKVIVTLNATTTMTGGVLSFEVDDGSGVWWAIAATRTAGASTIGQSDTTFTLSVTAQAWEADIAGWTQFRVRLSTVITGSGTANVAILPTAAAAEPAVVASQATAANFNANVSQATAANLNARTDTSGATGAAPPARADYIGGLVSGATGGLVGGITACDLSKPVNITTATTTLMVTGISGRQVRVCSFHLLTAAANNVAWLEGTGATCGTGTAGMAGGTTAASGYNFAANGGIALGAGVGEVLTTATTGDSVCLITSAATQLSGFIKYAIY